MSNTDWFHLIVLAGGAIVVLVVAFVVIPQLGGISRMREVRHAAERGYDEGYPPELVSIAQQILEQQKWYTISSDKIALHEAQQLMGVFLAGLQAWRRESGK